MNDLAILSRRRISEADAAPEPLNPILGFVVIVLASSGLWGMIAGVILWATS